jgi:hypothetical protein
LFCAAESEINRIVTMGALPGLTLPRSKSQAEPLTSQKKSQLE